MKKRVLLFVCFLFLFVFATQFSIADESDNESAAYDCLLSKVEGSKCNAVSNLEDKIFALWATGHCESQVMSSSNSNECWPKSSCNLEMTAKALIGLKDSNQDTDKISDWLLSQKAIPENIIWFLQVDSNEVAQCTIDFSDGTYSFTLTEDKKITKTSGTCFEVYNSYWLKIKDTCLDEEFTVECNESFSTNLIYREEDSNVFYVSYNTNEASAEDETTEKINSYCFEKGDSCDYEGSLWATLALDYLGEDVSSFMPYLLTNSGDNEEFFPDAFIYSIKGYSEYRTYLLGKQKSSGYWKEGSDRFYDTSLAMLALSGERFDGKEDAKDWLIDEQRETGCWGESSDEIGTTAFILFSTWPKGDSTVGCTTRSDCESDEQCFYGTCIPKTGECAGDRHCTGDEVCINYECEECRYDDDCEDNLFCSSDYECVECETYVDCDTGQDCDEDNECFNAQSCDDTEDCDNDDAECIGGYCIGGFPQCDSDSECEDEDGNEDYCSEDNVCVECRINSHCETGYECDDGECVRIGDECDSDRECGDGEYCNNDGICVKEGASCTDAGYYCRRSYSCTNDGGSILDEYDCSGLKICCDVPEEEETCSEKGGEICLSNSEVCEGGQEDTLASDLSSGEFCCISGSCETKEKISDCEFYNSEGYCRSSCWSGEKKVSDSCEDPLDVCCVPGETPGGGNYTWIWILLILIVLVVLGIIFREKLQIWFMQLKSRFGGKGSAKPRRPGFPPPPSGRPMMPRRPIQRRILPPQRSISKPSHPQKPKGDLDDVLKKLKEIGS